MFVFPSLYEGFGLPVVEAMACGAPVITGPYRGAGRSRRAARSSTSIGSTPTRSATRWSRWRASRERRERSGGARPRARARRSRGSARRAKRSRSIGCAAAPPRAVSVAVAPSRSRPARRSQDGAARSRGSASSTTDVLFGQAYFLRFDPKLWEARQPYAPLGALYAAAVRPGARLRGRAVRRDARRVGGRVGRRARSPSSARRGHLRGQLQLPEQDVPAAHARRRRSTMIDAARDARHRRRSSPDRTPAITRRSTSSAAPTSSSPAKARSRSSRCSTRSIGRAARARSTRLPASVLRDARRPRWSDDAAARDHPRSRRAAAPGVGSRRRRALPRDLAARVTATSR